MSFKPRKVAITNVRVFDGDKVTPVTDVVINGEYIGVDATGAEVIDGNGGILLPGLIDAHVHVTCTQHLELLAQHGVTTALDMGCWPPQLTNSLRNQLGLTDIRSAGIPLTSPGSLHSHIPNLPESALVQTAAEATEFVAQRVKEGSDYIKLVADVPGPSQDVLDAAAGAAQKHRMLSIAHAVSAKAVEMAQAARVDVITHVPLDTPITVSQAQQMFDEHRVCVPTLTMMRGITELKTSGMNYQAAHTSVENMHKSKVRVFAGTDANDQPGVPAAISYGASLHEELQLLVDTGFSPVQALRAATVETARFFGLDDRGVIEKDRRADLVLLSEDPTRDIAATKSIQRVWCGGIEVLRADSN